MENHFYYLIAALIIYLGVLVYSIFSTKSAKLDLSSYSRGKGAYRAIFIAVVMAVTMVGPADALALSQRGLQYGLIWAIFPIGAALAQLVTGSVFAKRIKNSFPEIETVGGIFKQRCSKSSTAAAGFTAFIQSIAFSGVLILAGGQVLETFMGLQKEIGMVVTALFVGGYTSFRGMIAVMKTDEVQGVLMGIMILILIIATGFITLNSGFSFSNSVFIKPDFYKDYDINLILVMFFGYFLGELLLPTYVVRASISKDESSASKGFKLASLILIVWYLLITYAGSLGQFISDEGRFASDNLIILDVVRTIAMENSVFYNVLGAFTFLVFISLIHSTFDSFLNNGALSFSKDILSNILNLNKKQEVWVSKQATIGISVLGLVIALWKDDLIDILFLGYTVWVPTILAPLIWIILNKNKNLLSQSFWGGLIIGLFVWILFDNFILFVIPSILIGLILNYITIVIIQKYYPSK